MRFGAASVAAHFDPECDGWRSSAHVSQLACGALFGEEASISARKHGRNGDGGGGVGSSAGVLSVCVHTVTRAGRPKKKKKELRLRILGPKQGPEELRPVWRDRGSVFRCAFYVRPRLFRTLGPGCPRPFPATNCRDRLQLTELAIPRRARSINFGV